MKTAVIVLCLVAVAVAKPQGFHPGFGGNFGGLGGGHRGFGGNFGGFGGGATGSAAAQSTQGLTSNLFGGTSQIQNSQAFAQVSTDL